MLQLDQCAFDSLCGIYSVLNAECVINDSPPERTRGLFNDIVSYLDSRRQLAPMLTQGMRFDSLQVILSGVLGQRIPYQRVCYEGTADPDLDSFWFEITRFLAGGTQRAVLLGYGDDHERWAVVHGISRDRIRVFDSDALVLMNRRDCTTSRHRSARQHVLLPARTYFLGHA